MLQGITEEEIVTPEEILEEHEFIDAIMETKVMDILLEFLTSKGLIQNSNHFKTILHKMWFALYDRNHRIQTETGSSCAFEHVFLGEKSTKKVIGLHNWLFVLVEEQKGM